MNNEEIAIHKYVVNKIWEVAHDCVDESRKGWRVKLPLFWGAMDDLDFTRREVREVLAFLEVKMYVLVFRDEDGCVTGISLVPQQYRCWQCNMLLDMQDDIRRHFDDCQKRQAKIQRSHHSTASFPILRFQSFLKT
jgi:hypothetical protein